MAIQITYDGGVYEIKGPLNAQNSASLNAHIQAVMKYSKGIVVSLNKVLDIESEAVKNIVALYNTANLNEYSFFIIGMKNKKVNDQFKALNLNQILL
jgi:anti-anti-sigma regulatory factor